MRKCTFLVILTLLISFFVPTTVEAVNFAPPFEITSEAAYLVNLDTDTVVYQKNSDKLMSPASLTKVMTAILVLENIDDIENTVVSAPSTAFDELYLSNASTADFRINEELSYSDLLYGLLLQSACEAANIISYNLGGSNMTTFIDMMNQKAAELGATSTNFTNAHGLYDDLQRSTAHDMAIIAEYAMNMPKFMEIASTVSYELKATNKHASSRTITHTNFMLNPQSNYYYKYALGIKTGTLDEAGRCLISKASKDGYNYLLVTLNAPLYDDTGAKVFYNFIDTKNIYEWAFSTFEFTNLLKSDEEIDEVKVEYGDKADYVLVKPENEYSTLWATNVDISTIQRIISVESSVMAPVNKGDKLGTMELKLNGQTITKVNLVAIKSIERSKWEYRIAIAKKFPSSLMFKKAIYISMGLLVIYTFLFILINTKKTKKNKRKTHRPSQKSKR